MGIITGIASFIIVAFIVGTKGVANIAISTTIIWIILYAIGTPIRFVFRSVNRKRLLSKENSSIRKSHLEKKINEIIGTENNIKNIFNQRYSEER